SQRASGGTKPARAIRISLSALQLHRQSAVPAGTIKSERYPAPFSRAVAPLALRPACLRPILPFVLTTLPKSSHHSYSPIRYPSVRAPDLSSVSITANWHFPTACSIVPKYFFTVTTSLSAGTSALMAPILPQLSRALAPDLACNPSALSSVIIIRRGQKTAIP